MSGLERGRVNLRIEDRESLSPSLPLLTRNGTDRSVPSLRLEAAPAVQLVARDSFVAETATKIEQLQASLRLMSREVDDLTRKVSELHDAATQDHRWHAFQESERRAREAKFDETLRCCRDLKARLDRIEPRASGDYHAYNSFEAVSRKLAELERFRDEAQRVERKVTFRAWLFCGATVLGATIIVASHVFAA